MKPGFELLACNYCGTFYLWHIFRKQLSRNSAEDELHSDLEMVQKIVGYIQELELGHIEYAIARCILFLNPLIGTQKGANEKIEKLQSEMVTKLGDLISVQRKEKVLLRINLSKQIHKKSLEVSFFSKFENWNF